MMPVQLYDKGHRVGNLLSCLLILFVAPTWARAQINTENMRKSDLSEGLHHALSFDFNLVSGNSEFYSLSGGFRTDYLSGGTYAFGVIQYQRGNEDQEDFINKAFLHLRLIRRFDRRISGEFFGQKEFNDFILLKDRILIGGGIRVDLLSNDSGPGEDRPVRLFLGSGAMWENEEIDTDPVTETRFFRSTNYVSLAWRADERVTLNTVAYYQVRFRDIEDYRILLESGFGFDLTESFAFQAGLNLRFDSDPPDGVKRHDIDFRNGLRLSF